MNFLEIDNAQQAQVLATLYGYYQDVVAKKNKFAGQVQKETFLKVIAQENPPCKEYTNFEGNRFWVMDFEKADTKRINRMLYESLLLPNNLFYQTPKTP